MLAGMAAAAPAQPGDFQAARPAYWFPLALFGALVGLSIPLYTLWLNTSPVFSGWVAYAPLTRSVTSSSSANAGYSSSFSVLLSSPGGLLGVPEGWYWATALTVGFLATTLWYRRTGAGRSLPYLITGLLLTAAATVVPPLVMPRASFPAWLWLSSQWASGTFALLIIAAAVWILARRARSRLLTAAALVYTVAALVADLPTLSSALSALSASGGDPLRTVMSVGFQTQPWTAALLPAGVLLVAAVLSFALPPRFRGELRVA
jgi:hypothetical protein